jgi:3-mercaptopyruvate sulfurtransferase SseA
MKKIICFSILLAMMLTTAATAMDRFDIVTTTELKQMLDDRESGKVDFILVNSLDEIIYRDSSIPGSINVSWSKIDKNAYKLGEDKDKLIVTY